MKLPTDIQTKIWKTVFEDVKKEFILNRPPLPLCSTHKDLKDYISDYITNPNSEKLLIVIRHDGVEDNDTASCLNLPIGVETMNINFLRLCLSGQPKYIRWCVNMNQYDPWMDQYQIVHYTH